MRLILVRHGEEDSERVSEAGRRCAELVAGQVASIANRTLPVEGVYAGPGSAAFHTARVVSNVLGLAGPVQHSGLAPLTPAAAEDGQRELQAQAWSAVESLQEQHSPDCTLVLVAGESLVRLLVSSALAIPSADTHRFRIDPASLTTLEFRVQPQRRVILAGLNETCHVEL